MAGISPNDFASVFGEFVQAQTREQSAAGLRRSISARMEKQGVNMRAFRLMLQLRKMEPADAEALLEDTLKLARWLNLEIGQQGKLFGTEVEAPNEEATGAVANALAYEEGYKAGRAGRDALDNRYQVGSPLAQQFFAGWRDGQAAIAAEMGVAPPEKPEQKLTPPKRGKKAKEGVEARDAQPRGGRRGRGRSGSAVH